MRGCCENPDGVLLEQPKRDKPRGPGAGESVHKPKQCIVVLKLTPKAQWHLFWGGCVCVYVYPTYQKY